MKKDIDITDKEWEELHLPYNDNVNNFMIKYIIPEVFCFQLANSFSRDCLCDATLEHHFNSMCDIIIIPVEFENIKPLVSDLLNIKYNLKIVNENPLRLEKWQ